MPPLGKKMELNQAFGRVFARLRMRNGLTQEDFHPAATDRYVRMLEKGKASPTIAMFCELSNVLNVSPAVLMALTTAEAGGLTEEDGLQTLQAALDNAKRIVKPS
jgi:transcriptional regulator with XRE-family HTH domain